MLLAEPLGAHRGLSAEEVAERVQRGETNRFRARVGRSYWEIIRDNVFNLFNVVLFTLLVVVLLYHQARHRPAVAEDHDVLPALHALDQLGQGLARLAERHAIHRAPPRPDMRPRRPGIQSSPVSAAGEARSRCTSGRFSTASIFIA
ncbi:hypothetical protein J4558_26420 [Leptolyngbya sp. 15MV]|nr:hypothetical protein J4558_26420 [Leptolyngbya sp. 15MV]